MYTPQRKLWPVTDRKGKAVAFADEITTPSPPTGYAVDDWRKFKEVGLLDEASMERKYRDALLEKVLNLEKELFDYQHNMGLLLIEKKKWTSTNEELQQALDEAGEILRRERNSSLIALTEAEKREENLRKALITEKQYVAELERDLKYFQQEHSEVKSTSEAKLAEANALVMGIKENALEVDRKRIIAEEKLSVINRKSSELERKLKDVETREKVLQREHLSLVTEREAHEAVFYKQREDLQEWEKKLTVEEERLSEAKRSINHREEKIVESERTIKKKEKAIEEMQQKIDIAESELKEKEKSLNSMLNDISLKEKMEIGKLLDDQKAVLDSRRQEFEMELEQRRKSLDEELERKKGEVDQLQVEISHKEENLTKREAALKKLEESVKEKDKDLESKLKALKEKEKALKAEEKKLHMENERLLEDKESLHTLKVEIEEIGAETTKQESRIREEHESIKITKEKKLEFMRLQSELKQQIDRVKQEKELLLKEREELKQDKEIFEKEWEALDEKKADIIREQKTSQLVEDLEKQRRNLDMELQRQEEEGEKDFNERARTYEKRSQEELENINQRKKLAQREMEEVQQEKLALEREKEEVSVQKKLLKEQEVEMRKDITELDVLRSSLKKQREEFISARERFLVYLEKLKSCNSCGEITKTFVLSDLQLPDVDKLSSKQLLKAEQAENIKKTSLLGKIASKILSISPIKKTENVVDLGIPAKLPESSHPDDTLDTEAGDDHEPSATEQSFTESRMQEGPEVSLQAEVKSDKPRRGRGRGKSVRGRSQATKAVSRDSKPSDGEIPKKRQREQSSKVTESEHAAAGDSDEGVDSVTTGGRRKKRQIAIPVSQTPGQSRYQLRRHRNVGTEENKAQASTGAMEKQESVDDGDIKTVPTPKDSHVPTQGDHNENGKAGVLVETHEKIVRVEAETVTFEDKNTGKRPVEDPQMEAGGSGEIREHGEDDDENFIMIEEENEEEEETARPSDDASIGKKIWVFFTT